MLRRVLYLASMAGLAALAVPATSQPLTAQDCAQCVSKTKCTSGTSGGEWCSFLSGECNERELGCSDGTVEPIQPVGMAGFERSWQLLIDGELLTFAQVSEDRFARWNCQNELTHLIERTAGGALRQLPVDIYRGEVNTQRVAFSS